MGNGNEDSRPLTVRELEVLLNATKQNTEQFTLLTEGMSKIFKALEDSTTAQNNQTASISQLLPALQNQAEMKKRIENTHAMVKYGWIPGLSALFAFIIWLLTNLPK